MWRYTTYFSSHTCTSLEGYLEMGGDKCLWSIASLYLSVCVVMLWRFKLNLGL